MPAVVQVGAAPAAANRAPLKLAHLSFMRRGSPIRMRANSQVAAGSTVALLG
jgi:hypothetical protein